MMKNRIIKVINAAAMLLLPLAALTLASCSSSTGSTQASASTGAETDTGRGGIILDAVTGTAVVQSIDASSRTVVLQHPDGAVTTYECGPEVRNFDQIKVGDQVTATAAEEMAIMLVKGGLAPAAGTATAVVRSPEGAKPGGKIIHTIGFTAKVMGVDVATREVTLQLPDGSTHKVKAGPDIDLEHVAVGDDVGVRITRAIAISVQTPHQSQ